MNSRPIARVRGWLKLAAAAAAVTFLIADVAEAQRQKPAPQGPNPAVRQFGPRVNPAARPQAAAPQVIASHGDWTIQCEQQPATASGPTAEPAGGPATSPENVAASNAQQPKAPERTCGIIQTARHEQRKNIAISLVLLRGEQQGKQMTMMRVMAPIGVYLPTGVALEIDGEAVGRVPFARCMPQTCIAFAEASPPTLEKLKKGGKANFIIYEAPGVGISLLLSLKGFTAALAELDKL